MSKNSEFMTRINRMPAGTELERKPYGKHRSLQWEGKIVLPNAGTIGPITNPDLGTVCKHLLILYRRENEDNET